MPTDPSCTYTANSTSKSVNGFTAISGGCFATIAERNANNKIDPCLNWSSDMRDTVDTVGVAYSQKGLIGGKLDVSAGLSYSYAKTTNDFTGGNYVNNPLAVASAAADTVAAYYIPATALPDVTTKTVDLKVFARYLINKTSSVRVGYRYQYMNSSDWAYDGLQYGGLTGVLPTSQVAPNYSVSTFAVAYIYSF